MKMPVTVDPRLHDAVIFDLDAVSLLSYRQTLDLRDAVLTRELRFRDDADRTTSVRQHRLVAMNQAHIAALEATIVAEDWSGTIEIRSTLDANVSNCGVERYSELASNHLESVKKTELTENSVLLNIQGQRGSRRFQLRSHREPPCGTNRLQRSQSTDWSMRNSKSVPRSSPNWRRANR